MLATQLKPIIKTAHLSTYPPDGMSMGLSISDKFAEKFAKGYEQAIKNMLNMITVIPLGGPASCLLPASTLQIDLYQAAYDALEQTFPDSYVDAAMCAKFANTFSNMCFAGHQLIVSTFVVPPAVPPVTPVTPGGPVIVPPTVSLVPLLLTAAQQALISTAPNDATSKAAIIPIAVAFGTTLSQIGNFVSPYIMSIAKVPPGGGKLIVS